MSLHLEVNAMPEQGLDEAVRDLVDFALRQGRELDGFRPAS